MHCRVVVLLVVLAASTVSPVVALTSVGSTPTAEPGVDVSFGVPAEIAVDRNTEAGSHQVVCDGLDAIGREVSSGMYLYQLTGAEGTLMRRMLLVR